MTAAKSPVAARARALFRQGLALHRQGRPQQALEIYGQVLEMQPAHYDALQLAGLIAHEAGDFPRALELLDRAIEINPQPPAAHGNRGNVLRALKRLDEALASYDRALELKPDDAMVYSNRGNALLALDRPDEALASYSRAVELKPDYAIAHGNRGNVLTELDRPEEALASCDRALALKPDYAEACSNRGNALMRLNRLDEALASYDRALELRPDYAEASSNRGNALRELLRLDEAVASYGRALQIRPDYAEAHRNRALCHLLQGDFARGWEGYEWRWQVKRVADKRAFRQPLWLGAEPLRGKTILLHGEQGLGDTLQFCRYAKLVSDLGARVILEVPAPLLALLANLAGVAQLVAKGSALPAFDCHCPLMSLPLAFKTRLDSIPSASAYLAADPAKVAAWRERLGQPAKPRVGLSWSGNPRHKADANRSIALAEMLKFLPRQYQYFSLQKELRSGDRETLDSNSHIQHFGADFADFADTAALCELMDVVVSVDTSIAHLAGAMGKPVWILLPFVPDWRWLLDRPDSPWYPSARLFRQGAAGEWAGVLGRVGADLERQLGDRVEMPREVSAAEIPVAARAQALFQQGLALHRQGRPQQALEIYGQVLEMQPAHFDALQLSGLIAYESGDFPRALELLDRAIGINPQFPAAHGNRGLALKELMRPDEALASYDRALELKPDYAEVHNNRGNALKELLRLDEAVVSYGRALQIRPDYAEAHRNRALCHLLRGDFARGWEENEWRWQVKRVVEKRDFKQPLWLGAAPLQGKTILLHGEQGLGDTLQFCRYAKLVSDLGARVILEVPGPLLTLLANLAGVAQLVAKGSALPPFGCHCPLLSLPLAFRTRLDTVPSAGAYIASSREKVGQWRQKLGDRAKPRVGLSWSGNPRHKADAKRSIALAEMLKFLPRQYQYFSLQKELRSGDRETLDSNSHIQHFGADFVDFTDTAALCELMDVVVSVDTSIAHLAGAMGKPVWILLPFVPDWRWLLDRPDSPWYPSARLFRQEAAGDWAGVLARVAADLERRPGDRVKMPRAKSAAKTPPPARAQALFRRGLALHNQGKPQQAQEIYRQVLEMQPAHFDALQLSGLIAYESGDFPRALELLDRAIEINPRFPAAHGNRGLALKGLQRPDEALASYDRAIELKPDYAEVHNNRGNALRELKRLDEALASHDRALELKPDYAQAYSNRGITLKRLKRVDEALASYDRALELKPDDAKTHSNRGNALLELDRLEEALASYDRALELKPDYAEAYNNRGNALQGLKRPREALACYQRALELRPGYAEAYNNRGNALLEIKQPGEALANYDRALALRPGYAEAYNNRGNALLEIRQPGEALASYDRALALRPEHAEAHGMRGMALKALKRLDEALASYDRALELKPDDATVRSNRGNALLELERQEEALASYDRALELKPDYAEAHNNRGNALRELMRLDEAFASYGRALQIRPDYAEAHWNSALCHLLLGDFARGWEGYEWRWQNKRVADKRAYRQPLWLGAEPLRGKTILLYGEQGLGDTLQFCRYAKLVSDLGARVILEVPAPLLALLANLAGVAQLVAKGSALPAFDCHCPLMSLPLAFKTRLDSIPSASAYLAADPAKVAAWRERLGQPAKPRVGLSWSGSAGNKADARRSIALSEIVKHLPRQFQYFSLQKDVRSGDQETLAAHQDILHFGADFADTAALCELMEVVVSVDTSIAHLAGAMGKPVWILLPFMPDWRWMLDRLDSPWYSSARLFRQDAAGDWAGVMERMGGALRSRFKR